MRLTALPVISSPKAFSRPETPLSRDGLFHRFRQHLRDGGLPQF